MRTLDFYFDYISNNAYLAWSQLQALSGDLDVIVRPRPVLFAGLLKAHQNVGPAEIPAKRTWMFKNILRKCVMLDVPISPPRHHPFNPLLALRASTMEMEEGARWRLIDGLFRAVWVDQLHVSEVEVVAEVSGQAGLDPDKVCRWAQSDEAAAVLREETEKAIGSGVFGIPSMMVGEELFFGYDDFPFLELYLRGEDPLDRAEIECWSQSKMTPSAERRKS